MGAFTNTLKIGGGVAALFTAAVVVVGGAGWFGKNKLDDAVDANNDGQATTQEYGSAAVGLAGDLVIEGIELTSGAVDKTPETFDRIADAARKEFPNLTIPDALPKVPTKDSEDDCFDENGSLKDKTLNTCVDLDLSF